MRWIVDKKDKINFENQRQVAYEVFYKIWISSLTSKIKEVILKILQFWMKKNPLVYYCIKLIIIWTNNIKKFTTYNSSQKYLD